MGTRSILIASLLLGGAASAELLPPAGQCALPRGLPVRNENDERQDLRAMAAGAPSLLLPVFTRCRGTCPMTALSLKEALAKARAAFRVVVLSFDAEDAARDLRDFRRRFGLPADWLLVRAADGAVTRAFLDELGFHFMKAGEGFDHPNETFVFSGGGAWAATFAGGAFPGEELTVAWRQALAADDPAAFPRLRLWLLRPEAWIILACMGLGVSSLAIVLLARKARARLTPARHRSR